MKRKHVVLGSAFVVVAVALATGLSSTACGKKKKSSVNEGVETTTLAEGSSIAISGKLNITTAASLNFADSTDLASLSVYCVTFSNPPVAGTGTVNAEGVFSLTLAAAQQAVGCFILKGEEQLGTIVFKNPNKKSLSGTAKTEQRQAFGGDTELGNITLNLATGQAEVDVTQIKTTLKDTTSANAAGTAYDFTGAYTLEPVNFDLPKGYVTACAPGTQECRGPQAGEPIWMKRVDGKFVADGKPAYGVMIWQSEDLFKACGSKLGFSYEDAKNYGGIDLSGSGIGEGEYTWANGWIDGWKSPSATVMWPQTKMEKAVIGGYTGQKQFFDSYKANSCSQSGCTNSTVTANGYMFNAESNETGCRVNGEPYQLNDWSNMECTFTDKGNGLSQNTCTKNDAGKEVTCVHIGGMFLENGTPLSNTEGTWYHADYPDDFIVYGSQGQSCSQMSGLDGSNSAKLAQDRCYAQSYYESAEQAGQQGLCVRKVQTNWMAERSEDFISDGGPVKAHGQHIFEAFEYDSANSGSFRAEERHFEGIQVGDNWDSCEVSEAMTFSVRKEDNSTDLITEMIMEKRNVSSKPACIAYFASKGDNGVQKMMFKMKKQ